MSISVWGSQATRRVRFVEALRKDLGDDEFEALLAQGGALSFDDAIDLVTAT